MCRPALGEQCRILEAHRDLAGAADYAGIHAIDAAIGADGAHLLRPTCEAGLVRFLGPPCWSGFVLPRLLSGNIGSNDVSAAPGRSFGRNVAFNPSANLISVTCPGRIRVGGAGPASTSGTLRRNLATSLKRSGGTIMPRSTCWGVPDWQDAASYPNPEKANERSWRWQFVRRRDDYRKAWDEWAPRTREEDLVRSPGANIMPICHLDFCADIPDAQTSFGIKGRCPNPRNPSPDYS